MKLFTGLTKMQISAQTEVNLKGMGVHLAAACRRTLIITHGLMWTNLLVAYQLAHISK